MHLRITAKQHIFRPYEHFRHAHASTLLRLADGRVLVAYFAGTKEQHVDVGIWCSTGRDGVFSPPRCVFRDARWPCWNPVLHADDNGVVYLFCKVGPSPEHWWSVLLTSRDNGASFGPAVRLVPGDTSGRGPAKNKLVATAPRRWVAGMSTETGDRWTACADITEDGGQTWSCTETIALPGETTGKGVIQPALWQSASGRLHMLLRSDAGCLYRSDSTDGGSTWGPAYPTGLPNNNSGIDVAYMQSGVLALVMNDTAENWGMRTPLALLLSKDNGETWPDRITLEHNDAPTDRHDGEFSYPAVITWADRLLISYTWKRQTIELVELLVQP